MKKLKIFILLMIVIIIIFTIIFVIVLNKNVNSYVPEEVGGNTGNTEYEDFGYKIREVTSINDYYIVQTCVNKFYNYYMQSFQNNSDEESLKSSIETFYNMLDTEYINEKEITKENILNKIEKIDESDIYITETLVALQNENNNMYVYFVKGFLNHLSTSENKDFYLIVEIDSLNRTFEIVLEDYIKEKGWDKVKIGDAIQIVNQKEIENRGNNQYRYNSINQTTYVSDLFDNYRKIMLNNPSKAYELLQEEYKEKRFPLEDDFEEYVKNNYKNIYISTANEYKTEEIDGITEYVIIDKHNNYYIFQEKGIMNYKVMLDTYTIDTNDFIKKYNSSDEQTKVGMNIQKFIDAINHKDYQYAYNLLDETFKKNYFPDIQKFEEYIKNNLFENNKVTFEKFSFDANNYIYDLILEDDKMNKKDFTIIMRLEEDTKFVMSFKVD